VHLRTAQASDAEELARLINQAFLAERPIFDGERISTEGVCQYLRKGTFLLACDADQLVGSVFAELRGATGYIGLLSVAPSRQGTGLGRRLTQAAEERFRDAGCREAELRVLSARKPLFAFYEHLGYSASRIEPLPSGATPKVPCHFVYMSKKLS
jgi:GNAT superfamily N-acetyltransferase